MYCVIPVVQEQKMAINLKVIRSKRINVEKAYKHELHLIETSQIFSESEKIVKLRDLDLTFLKLNLYYLRSLQLRKYYRFTVGEINTKIFNDHFLELTMK